MANSAVYARIDPTLKGDVEDILTTLGVTPSALIQMLYAQIKLRKGIPFEIKFPESKPVAVENLSKEQFDLELQKGIQDVEEGRVLSRNQVDHKLKKELGI